jgi:type VI secretion system protein ImpI
MRWEGVRLTLHVKSHRGEPDGSHATKEFSQAGGTIGRAKKDSDSHLVLTDPRRVISSLHARISFDDGAYVLEDKSTNGTFLNGSTDPIGKGNRVRLTHGDVLRIGDYELRVDVTAAEPAGDPFSPPAPAVDLPDPLDPFAPPAQPSPPEIGDDLFAPREQAARPATGFGIPEDLDPLELLNDTPAIPPPPPAMGARSDHVPAENFHFSTPRPVGAPIPDDWDDSNVRKAPTRAPASPAPPPPVAPPSPALSPTGDEGGGSAARVLMAAAALPLDRIDDRPVDELVAEAGRILRTVVGGLMELLAERSTFKREFRVEQTMIGPIENNPLKLARTPEEALTHLLLPSGQAFLHGEEAVQQAIQDLKDHRVAMLAAMRTAFEALLHHFDPDRLETTFGSSAKPAALALLTGKGRAWERYREFYAELQQDPDQLFREVIDEAFARAYEAQVGRLQKERG